MRVIMIGDGDDGAHASRATMIESRPGCNARMDNDAWRFSPAALRAAAKEGHEDPNATTIAAMLALAACWNAGWGPLLAEVAHAPRRILGETRQGVQH